MHDREDFRASIRPHVSIQFASLKIWDSLASDPTTMVNRLISDPREAVYRCINSVPCQLKDSAEEKSNEQGHRSDDSRSLREWRGDSNRRIAHSSRKPVTKTSCVSRCSSRSKRFRNGCDEPF